MLLFELVVKVGVVGARRADDGGRGRGRGDWAAMPLVVVVVEVVVVAAGPRCDG